MPPQDPQPQIDAQYWFNFSKTLVDGSIERIDKSITAFGTLITAIYGLYTGANLLTLQFTNFTNKALYIPALIILALPYTLLLIAQWQIASSTGPATAEFDPNSDSQIRKAYETIYTAKEEQLNAAKRLSFLAVASTGLALTAAFVLSKLPTAVEQQPYLKIEYVQTRSKQHEIAVAGYIANNEENRYRLTIAQQKKDSVKIVYDHTLINTKSGEFQQSVSVAPDTLPFTATLEWKQGGTHTITQSVKPAAIKQPTTSKGGSTTSAKEDTTKKAPSNLNR